MKRLFIASTITFDAQTKQFIANLQRNLAYNKIVWVKEDVVHLTLRFLGQTPDLEIPKIKEIMDLATQPFSPFTMQLDQLGVFGSRYSPQVVWLGFHAFETYLQLFKAIEEPLIESGFQPAYGNFVPHITLGRIKNIIDKPFFWKWIEQHTNSVSQSITINKITLFQSKLTNEGPIYKSLHSVSLKGL
ncbi:MAG: RNA 2',3'-cyclic phosphodiesterase [Bacteroidales bacterium]|jgi:2'-5' RNA ligase|nr:RNA 2',3'-cyclic phosphodiesterase [Bacteroidales bacterium]